MLPLDVTVVPLKTQLVREGQKSRGVRAAEGGQPEHGEEVRAPHLDMRPRITIRIPHDSALWAGNENTTRHSLFNKTCIIDVAIFGDERELEKEKHVKSIQAE